jgi:hypothetical protein
MSENVQNGGGTATAEPKQRNKPVNRNISNREFIQVWNASESPADCAKRLSNDQRGQVPVEYVSARAAKLRKDNVVDLKSFRVAGHGGRPANTEDLVTLQADIWAETNSIQQGSEKYNEYLKNLRDRIAQSQKDREEAAARRKAAKEAKNQSQSQAQAQTAAA